MQNQNFIQTQETCPSEVTCGDAGVDETTVVAIVVVAAQADGGREETHCTRPLCFRPLLCFLKIFYLKNVTFLFLPFIIRIFAPKITRYYIL